MNDPIAFRLPAATDETRIGAPSVAIPDSHAGCYACRSLGLRFQPSPEGIVASLYAHKAWEGYTGIMHGGMIATLLDAAMTHCLFHHGIEGVTADLHLRYLDAVPCQGRIDISARLSRQRRRVYELDAELSIAGQVRVRAHARFMQRAGQTAERERVACLDVPPLELDERAP